MSIAMVVPISAKCPQFKNDNVRARYSGSS